MPLLYGGSRRLVLDYHRRAVALLDRAIVRLLPAVPKPVVQRLSSRYIAGPALDDAIRVVRKLNASEPDSGSVMACTPMSDPSLRPGR